MKKIILATLALSFIAALADQALALRWPTNLSRRVESMGGALLAIEDKSTAITTFNHQNGAGILFDGKQNYFELGAGYTSYDYSLTNGSDKETTNLTGLELTRPNTEYRGLVYWLDDSLMIRAGVEGMTSTFTEKSEIAGTVLEDKFTFSGLGGGASINYKTSVGLGLSLGAAYIGAGGKPDKLTGAFAVLPVSTSKLELASTNLDWNASAVYEIPNLGENGKLDLGLTLHADDNKPNILELTGLSAANMPDGTEFQDYSSELTIAGRVSPSIGDVTHKYTYTITPFTISGEAIYSMGTLFSGGVLFDSKTKTINRKEAYTGYELLPAATRQFMGVDDKDYKSAEVSQLAITPIVKANIPMGGDISVLPGLYFSSQGTGTTSSYTRNTSGSTFKSNVKDEIAGTIGFGLGLQALQKQFQCGFEIDSTSWTTTNKHYDSNNTLVYETKTDDPGCAGSKTTVGVGAEFWVIPMLALRAGFSTLADVTKKATTVNGELKDVTNTTSRITLGAGVKTPDGLVVDLLIRMDSTKRNPAADPEPTQSQFGALIDLCLPI